LHLSPYKKRTGSRNIASLARIVELIMPKVEELLARIAAKG
jgi:hypothetical protein